MSGYDFPGRRLPVTSHRRDVQRIMTMFWHGASSREVVMQLSKPVTAVSKRGDI
jgi:hypothetical protein